MSQLSSEQIEQSQNCGSMPDSSQTPSQKSDFNAAVSKGRTGGCRNFDLSKSQRGVIAGVP